MTTTAPAPRRTEDDTAGTPGLWLTTALRPAGPMSGRGGARFAAAVRAASDVSEVVLVDLRAVGPLPRSVRRALADADARLTAAGGALLVMDPDDGDPVPAHLLASAAIEAFPPGRGRA